MKRLGIVATAVALVVACARLGFAQNTIQEGQKVQPGTLAPTLVGGISLDSLGHVLRFDPSGNLYAIDPSKDRDTWRLYPNVMNNQFGATTTGGNIMSDSSSVMDTHDMRQLWAVIYYSLDSLSTNVRLAMEVRGSYSTANDSSSDYVWTPHSFFSPTSFTDGGIDSLGDYSTGQYRANVQATTGDSLWDGETAIRFQTRVTDDGSGNWSSFGGYPKGKWIPLTDSHGVPFWAPYTTIRLRVINGIKSRFKYRVDVVGSSIR